MAKDKPLYLCYSIPLKQYLLDKGFNYEFVALNPKTNKTFWVFIKNEQFNKALTEWSK